MDQLIVLPSRAETLGLKPEAWESIKQIGDIQDMVSMMRNVLHLAIAFSPLILLVPKKFTHESIRRDHLLAVSSFAICSSTNSWLASACSYIWK